jgi:Matrixin
MNPSLDGCDMMTRKRRERRRRLVVELLESRAVPATFGVPWSDPSRLTLSFAPDGTPLDGHTSSLLQTLNSQLPTAVWQREILQAFQTWAVQANINVGLVADGGQAFGTAGPSQHDPRFGDIRVGGQSTSPSALSISVPNDPTLSSSWTGDVLINTTADFGNGGLNLEAVLLHEAGHVFGLGDNTDRSSPLFGQYQDNQQLTSNDISALQALYGVRSLDPHEGSGGNDTISTATQIQFPGGYTGKTPLVVFGDIGSNKDVDVYAIRPPNNYNGPVTFQLQSAGISLLTTKLTVMDAQGNVVGSAQAASDFGDTVTVHLNQSSSNSTYYLKVQGATQDVFGIGTYGLAVTFDATNTITSSALETVLRGPYQSLSPNDINAIFVNPSGVLLNAPGGGGGGGGGGGSNIQLTSLPGYAQNTHYETIGSLASPSETDTYRISVPNGSSGQSLVLTATVRAIAPNGVAPRITILDTDQNVVQAQILANGNGVFTIQASSLKSKGIYELTVSTAGSASGVGNYALDAAFGSATADLSTFAGGSVSASSPQQSFNLYVGESQLFQFLLSAAGSNVPAGSAVQMTIRDKNGNIVYSLTAAAGDTMSSDALLLDPGAYVLSFTVLGPPGGPVPTFAYSLLGESISDPIGAVVNDPTLVPIYTSPTTPGVFLYPNNVPSPIPFMIAPIIA